MAKIGLSIVGCPKALVDSENILTGLKAEGYESLTVMLILDLVKRNNTCGFIDSAVEEVIKRDCEALKEKW